jgi:hypothetical protein
MGHSLLDAFMFMAQDGHSFFFISSNANFILACPLPRRHGAGLSAPIHAKRGISTSIPHAITSFPSRLVSAKAISEIF